MANISIEIISVGQPSAVKTYKVIEVAYKKDGKIEGKKIMSFTNPGVFAAIQKLTPGQVVSVGLEKNDAGYWQWVSIGAVEATSAPVGATAVSSAPARSNYETSEERANRQILIVRQSSLGHAVATLSVGSKGVKGGDVIALAEQYAHYVLNGDTDKRESLDIFEDDTPL
jgi:hypothetical protein